MSRYCYKSILQISEEKKIVIPAHFFCIFLFCEFLMYFFVFAAYFFCVDLFELLLKHYISINIALISTLIDPNKNFIANFIIEVQFEKTQFENLKLHRRLCIN